MRASNLWFLVALFAGTAALAQMTTYHLGRVPTDEEIRAMDTIIGPRGDGLPPGKGTAREGEPLFTTKCTACHGRNGEGTKVGSQIIGDVAIDNYPFATSVWSYIYNAMPRNLAVTGLRDGTLTADETYALTAFILYKDNIIKEDEVVDAQSLPKISMPRRDHHLDVLAPAANTAKH